MRTFGLTGGIGTGKSTVAELLRARGVPVVDADQVARDVVAPGSPGLAEVVAAFGPEVLVDGALDRRRLRAIVMADVDARRRLEAITHPRIHAAIVGWLDAQRGLGAPIAGVEAALMVETGSWWRYDALVVVTCATEVQIARVMARDGVDRAGAEAVLRAQLPLAEKEAVATHVIRNDGDRGALAGRVDAVLAALIA